MVTTKPKLPEWVSGCINIVSYFVAYYSFVYMLFFSGHIFNLSRNSRKKEKLWCRWRSEKFSWKPKRCPLNVAISLKKIFEIVLEKCVKRTSKRQRKKSLLEFNMRNSIRIHGDLYHYIILKAYIWNWWAIFRFEDVLYWTKWNI